MRPSSFPRPAAVTSIPPVRMWILGSWLGSVAAVALAQPPLVGPQAVPGSAGGSVSAAPLPEPLSAPPAWPQSPPATPEDLAPQYLVEDVRITGNEVVSIDRIYSLINTRKGRIFDELTLQQDKQNLLTKGLFRDVEIEWRRTATGVIVTFDVRERPTIRYIRFLGDRGLGEKTLRKEIGIKEKDALNPYAVEEARRKLEDLYHHKGFPKATVSIQEGNRTEDRGVVFAIAEGPLQRIQAVEFTGNSSIASDGRLKTQIESKPSFMRYVFPAKLDHDKIASDIEKLTAYYRSLGFFRARVGRKLVFDNNNRWVTINFVIDEGPRYVVRNVSVVGNQKFRTDELSSKLQLKPGDYFRLEYMQADVNELRDMYGSQGYIFADIESKPIFQEDSELDLVYDIAEGEQFRVGKISVKIAGEYPHTKERVILDRLSIRPGDIVDIRKIRDSERRLKASQLFIVNPAEGDPPQIVIVPPDLKDAKEVLASRGNGTYRGQNPESSEPVIDLLIDLPTQTNGIW
ncbi:MAG: POTRA domain-containing protein [Pirellulaceae bacterium]